MACCVDVGVPAATKVSVKDMEMISAEPAFWTRLGRAWGRSRWRLLVKLTAARVATDGVADSESPGGNLTEAFNTRLGPAISGRMVVTAVKGATACCMAADKSAAIAAALAVPEGWDVKARDSVSVA